MGGPSTRLLVFLEAPDGGPSTRHLDMISRIVKERWKIWKGELHRIYFWKNDQILNVRHSEIFQIWSLKIKVRIWAQIGPWGKVRILFCEKNRHYYSLLIKKLGFPSGLLKKKRKRRKTSQHRIISFLFVLKLSGRLNSESCIIYLGEIPSRKAHKKSRKSTPKILPLNQQPRRKKMKLRPVLNTPIQETQISHPLQKLVFQPLWRGFLFDTMSC